MFLGREKEIKLLKLLKSNSKSSMVVCRGRRRIGKSTLIEHFAENFENRVLIQGLAPEDGVTREGQLRNFMEMLCQQVDIPTIETDSWGKAFDYLYSFTKDKEVLILLDEISWMAAGDPEFLGKLKIAWDTKLKKNNKLIIVLCGSITSWIDSNILNSTNFLGRVSLTLTVKELEINFLKQFLGRKNLSSKEALKILSITGGVPRYLEEINKKLDAKANISKLCFRKEGILFNEFDKIFSDIFDKKAFVYKTIVESLVSSALTGKEISEKLGNEQSGVISSYLEDLCESGFLRRSYSWSLKSGKKSKLSKYRITDNYLRFYLKYIFPNKKKIESDLFQDGHLPIKNFDAILGLQFESLVLNNFQEIIRTLNIRPESIINFGPYFQNKTNRQDSCQIDLLIQTESSYYICEIKLKEKIGAEVNKEIYSKVNKLKVDTAKSIKTVLIYSGKLTKELENDDYLDFKIDFPSSFWN